jgi:hypothetical protein
MAPKSPLGGSPLAQQPREIQQQPQQPNRMPQVTSPLPAALSAIYGPLAALQNNRNAVNGGIDPAITAATTQLLSNLAAVTNGGKGGKNPRPFKGNNNFNFPPLEICILIIILFKQLIRVIQ